MLPISGKGGGALSLQRLQMEFSNFACVEGPQSAKILASLARFQFLRNFFLRNHCNKSCRFCHKNSMNKIFCASGAKGYSDFANTKIYKQISLPKTWGGGEKA